MKSNNRIGTLDRFKAKSLLIAASALATFTLVQPVSADPSVLNRLGVYEQTIARPAWPIHVESRLVAPREHGDAASPDKGARGRVGVPAASLEGQAGSSQEGWLERQRRVTDGSPE